MVKEQVSALVSSYSLNSNSFSGTNGEKLIYKNTKILNLFVNTQRKILPRRITGLNNKQQRQLSKAIKTARIFGIMPFAIPITQSIND
jgi:small subunit ribosomal protein S18